MKKKTIIVSIAAVVLVIIFFILFMWMFIFNQPCRNITDGSQKADCFMNLAVENKDIQYCTLNYYTQECIQSADPQHTADKQDARALCEQVSDSSKRQSCIEYVDEMY
jgi:cell division protein FtsL